MSEKTELCRSFNAGVLPLFSERRLVAVVDRVFSFANVREAHEYLESNANFGKVVVLVD
jgi:NADPH:quinone reductase-like Zn-dependent oxidoreductase